MTSRPHYHLACDNCRHPDVEHVDETGACKVKDCDCEGFVRPSDAGDEPQRPPGLPKRHTAIARATDASGQQGLEIVSANEDGWLDEITQDQLVNYVAEAREAYRRSFGEDPEMAAVGLVPYLAPVDEDDFDGDDPDPEGHPGPPGAEPMADPGWPGMPPISPN